MDEVATTKPFTRKDVQKLLYPNTKAVYEEICDLLTGEHASERVREVGRCYNAWRIVAPPNATEEELYETAVKQAEALKSLAFNMSDIALARVAEVFSLLEPTTNQLYNCIAFTGMTSQNDPAIWNNDLRALQQEQEEGNK